MKRRRSAVAAAAAAATAAAAPPRLRDDAPPSRLTTSSPQHIASAPSCRGAAVPQGRCAAVAPCREAAESRSCRVAEPLCRCAAVQPCRHIAVSPCRCAAAPLCRNVVVHRYSSSSAIARIDRACSVQSIAAAAVRHPCNVRKCPFTSVNVRQRLPTSAKVHQCPTTSSALILHHLLSFAVVCSRCSARFTVAPSTTAFKNFKLPNLIPRIPAAFEFKNMRGNLDHLSIVGLGSYCQCTR